MLDKGTWRKDYWFLFFICSLVWFLYTAKCEFSSKNFVFTSKTGLPRVVLVLRWVLFVPEIFVSPLSEFEQHMYSSDPRPDTDSLRVTDSKYRESLDRFEKSKTLKLCLKNAFREMSSKMLFRFSKNLTPSRNSQKTKIHLFTSLNMQKISGKLTKFSVIALKQFRILEQGINLA